jgi:hypothetical protein
MAQVKGEAAQATSQKQTKPERRRRTWSHPPRVLWRAFDRSEEAVQRVVQAFIAEAIVRLTTQHQHNQSHY